MVQIRVDFYKESGKWYSGGTVDVGDARLWQGPKFKQAIVDNQHILVDGWVNDTFYVVTNGLPENSSNPEYREFSMALFKPGVFAGMVRKLPEEVQPK